MLSSIAYKIFEQSIDDYHHQKELDPEPTNPYDKSSIKHLFYLKNWIDTIQWHYEDIIRDPNIDPLEALQLKRKIDKSNQRRTDMVEYIDSYFLKKYTSITPKINSTINTETPAWAIDRLSILALKIYHMREEAERDNTTKEHQQRCFDKLQILLEQKADLSTAIDQLIQDIEMGNKHMKAYKQMKMYNDDTLNPILYKNK